MDDAVPERRDGRVIVGEVSHALPTVDPIRPVILSGGSGTRLWPLSRRELPKQLLPLIGAESMLQAVIARTAGDSHFGEPIILCNERHEFLVDDQLRGVQISPESLVLEPLARNTAPALAVAALAIQARGEDSLMLVQPSDHIIADLAAFRVAISQARSAAEQGWLVTFGIRPERPETGYGYIRRAEKLAECPFAYAVDHFVEKPARDRAEEYVANGTHFWNSGIFLMKASAYLAELDRYHPEIRAASERALAGAVRRAGTLRLDAAAFASSPALSIDRAVLEKTARAAVVPMDIGWSDVGNWRSLRDMLGKDDNGNVLEGDVLVEEVHDSYLRSDHKLIAAIGLDGVIVVSTGDVVLVASADRASDIGQFVTRLETENRSEAARHRCIHRPWGCYETIDRGDRFQAKRIVVKPGGCLSLQMHHHRAEHWVVVAGTAKVTVDDETRLVGESESVFIPLGSTHRLENPGKVPMQLIEVQTGTYLEEDDIVRIEDAYGRA